MENLQNISSKLSGFVYQKIVTFICGGIFFWTLPFQFFFFLNMYNKKRLKKFFFWKKKVFYKTQM